MNNPKFMAFVRSEYHIELLNQNIDTHCELKVVVLNKSLFKKIRREKYKIDSIYLPEEMEIGTNFLNCRWHLRKYYGQISRMIDDFNPENVIVFFNYTPMSRYVIDYCQIRQTKVMLWEDGLNHYLNYHNGLVFYLKAIAKLLLGFYPVGIFSVSYKKEFLETRDRFLNKKLNYKINKSNIDSSAIYFIGQPIVEDKILSQSKYFGLVRACFEMQPNMKYLPHPRETVFNSQLDSKDILLTDVSSEKQIVNNGARCIISLFSTVNVNVSVENNYFLVCIVGLKDIGVKLKRIERETGVSLVESMEDLKGKLRNV